MSNLPDWMTDGCWAGQAVYIVGAEAQEGDVETLPDEAPKIAIGGAGDLIDATVVVTMDFPFARDRTDLPVLHVNHSRRDPVEGCWEIYSPTVDNWGMKITTTLEDGIACGGSSLFAAINLSFVLGADPVFLVGCRFEGSAYNTRRTALARLAEQIEMTVYATEPSSLDMFCLTSSSTEAVIPVMPFYPEYGETPGEDDSDFDETPIEEMGI